MERKHRTLLMYKKDFAGKKKIEEVNRDKKEPFCRYEIQEK